MSATADPGYIRYLATGGSYELLKREWLDADGVSTVRPERRAMLRLGWRCLDRTGAIVTTRVAIEDLPGLADCLPEGMRT